MSENVQHCPLCDSTQSTIFEQRIFRGQQVNNRICTTCGLVYQSPRMSQDELNKFYEAEYRQLYQSSEGPDAKDLAIQQSRAASLLTFTKKQVDRISNYLDIGCSAGSLLLRMQQEYHCQSVGIEPGNAYRTYASAQNLTVYESLETLQSSADTLFDFISLAHVLEHLPRPSEYLAYLRQALLTENGYLLVEVPNLYAHDSFEVAHLVSFSAHTLAQTVQKAGFKIIHLEQHGRPRSKLLPLYLTALAQPSINSKHFQIEPEKSVQRKRQLGLLRRHILTRLFPHQAWLPIEYLN